MPTQEKGFSLIELIVVMLLFGIVAAIAIPQMSGTLFNTTYRDSAQEVLRVLRQGRSRAVSNNLEYRAEIDVANHRIRLTEGNRSSSSTAWTTAIDWLNMPNTVNLRAKSDCTSTDNINFVFKPNGMAEIDPDVVPATVAEITASGFVCIMNANDLTQPEKHIVSIPHNDTTVPIESTTGRSVIQ